MTKPALGLTLPNDPEGNDWVPGETTFPKYDYFA
jgi:hypothetical protein